MVGIEKSSKKGASGWKAKLPVIGFAGVVGLFLLSTAMNDTSSTTTLVSSLYATPGNEYADGVTASGQDRRKAMLKKSVILKDKSSFSDLTKKAGFLSQKEVSQCPIMKISDLSPTAQHPVKNSRYQVTPPEGGLAHLLCCQTTQGPFNAMVHESWAPLGAKRVLNMVQSGYFNSKNGVPLMRCIKDFICQFGLNSDPKLSNEFKLVLEDDKNWLPEGPKHRKNSKGVVRFARGYLAYAGGGPNTRDNQLIVSLTNVETLAGGSPWEVPWGELVGKHSFDTLAKFYTGYGEDGPQQNDLWQKGVTKDTKKKFPKLDYITGCSVVDQAIQANPYFKFDKQ